MDVCIDATRCDEPAFAVEHLCISRTQISQVAPNANDESTLDTDFLTNDGVCGVNLIAPVVRNRNWNWKAAGTYDNVIANHQVKIHLAMHLLCSLVVVS